MSYLSIRPTSFQLFDKTKTKLYFQWKLIWGNLKKSFKSQSIRESLTYAPYIIDDIVVR